MEMSKQANNENESTKNLSQIKWKTYKKRKRLQTNIAIHSNRLNAPLDQISLPDDLILVLNRISNDASSSNRLFTTVLSTKQSSIQLNSGEKLLDSNACDTVQVRATSIQAFIILSLCADKSLDLKFKL